MKTSVGSRPPRVPKSPKPAAVPCGSAANGAQARLDRWATTAESIPLPQGVRPSEGNEPAPVSRSRTEATLWADKVDEYIRYRDSEGLIGRRWVSGLRFTLLRLPKVWGRLGVDPLPRGPADLGSNHLAVLRGGAGWERATLQFYFSSLRGFARWGGNRLADETTPWRLPPGVARRRRWLTKAHLQELARAATGRARLLVSLEGFNGLRRIEVLRLRAQDVNLAEGLLSVLGKGRMGGKWRQIPLHRTARPELARALRGLKPEDRILPISASGADVLLRKAADAAGFSTRGIRVSHHDLRRSFGRLAHAAGMDLVQLKNLYGHASMDMTVHYVGLDMDRMRSGLGRFERFMAGAAADH
jgi:integrase